MVRIIKCDACKFEIDEESMLMKERFLTIDDIHFDTLRNRFSLKGQIHICQRCAKKYELIIKKFKEGKIEFKTKNGKSK